MNMNLTKLAFLVIFSPIIALELAIGIVLVALVAVSALGSWLWSQHAVGARRRITE